MKSQWKVKLQWAKLHWGLKPDHRVLELGPWLPCCCILLCCMCELINCSMVSHQSQTEGETVREKEGTWNEKRRPRPKQGFWATSCFAYEDKEDLSMGGLELPRAWDFPSWVFGTMLDHQRVVVERRWKEVWSDHVYSQKKGLHGMMGCRPL